MNEIKDYTILLVPGFLAQVYEGINKQASALSTERLIEGAKKIPLIGNEIASLIPRVKLPMDPDSGISFSQQEKAFHERGIDCVNMDRMTPSFNTQSSVEKNGAAIREALGNMGNRKVLIVSHSKGGLDTLDALIKADDSQLATVHGWLSIQSPFFGSPLADAGSTVLTELGVEMAALHDLNVTVRDSYMKQHADTIAGLVERIPVSCVFSTYEASTGNALANAAIELAKHVFDPTVFTDIVAIGLKNARLYWYWPPAAAAHDVTDAISLISSRINQAVKDVFGSFGLMDGTNYLVRPVPNDGLVPEDSAKLPGAQLARLAPDTDHAGPVMSVTPFRNFWTAKHRITDTDARLVRLINPEAC